MKHIGTVVFLIGCLALGIGIGMYFLQGKKPVTPLARYDPPIGQGPLPVMRGVHSELTLASPIEEWKKRIEHDAALGATWMTVNVGAPYADTPANGLALGALVQAAHDAHMKLLVLADLVDLKGVITKPVDDSISTPPSVESIDALLVAAKAADVDILALDPHIGETEPADDQWLAFVTKVKERTQTPICFIADFAAAPRVTWWTKVDYVGVRGPIPLTDRADGKTPADTLHFLEMSWRAKQDLVASLNLRDEKPILFFEVGYPEKGQRTDLSYEAALIMTRGQARIGKEPWLVGLFLRMPPDASAASRIEAIVKEQWFKAK